MRFVKLAINKKWISRRPCYMEGRQMAKAPEIVGKTLSTLTEGTEFY